MQSRPGRRALLNSHDFALGFDGFELVQLALAAAGANLAGRFPVLRRLEIRVPEGPRFALPRPRMIDRALARFTIEEDAIAVRKFDQAFARADAAHIFAFEFLDVELDLCRQGRNLFLVYPNVPWRTGAAIAAL